MPSILLPRRFTPPAANDAQRCASLCDVGHAAGNRPGDEHCSMECFFIPQSLELVDILGRSPPGLVAPCLRDGLLIPRRRKSQNLRKQWKNRIKFSCFEHQPATSYSKNTLTYPNFICYSILFSIALVSVLTNDTKMPVYPVFIGIFLSLLNFRPAVQNLERV